MGVCVRGESSQKPESSFPFLVLCVESLRAERAGITTLKVTTKGWIQAIRSSLVAMRYSWMAAVCHSPKQTPSSPLPRSPPRRHAIYTHPSPRSSICSVCTLLKIFLTHRP